MKTDPNIKFVLKEFPVLGEGSVEAAHVAVAARMQDPTGKKYIEFHQKLLGGRGPADKAHALAAAKDTGFDMARIEKDMNSDEVKATIDETMKLADALGVSGTPSYVVGTELVVGAVGLDSLEGKNRRGAEVRSSIVGVRIDHPPPFPGEGFFVLLFGQIVAVHPTAVGTARLGVERGVTVMRCQPNAGIDRALGLHPGRCRGQESFHVLDRRRRAAPAASFTLIASVTLAARSLLHILRNSAFEA